MKKDTGALQAKRFDSCRMLITVSQTGEFDVEEVLEKIKERFGRRLRYCCIAREKHIDKGIHCHVFIELNKIMKFHYSSFDFLFDKKANIQMVRADIEDKLKAWRYVKKCQRYIQYGEKSFEESKEKIGSIKSFVTKMIQEGITLSSLLEHENTKVSSYAFEHSKHIRGMIYEYENLMLLKAFKKLEGMKMVNIPRIKALQHPEALKWAEMGESLNEAVEYKHTRPFKTLNLHLWSREPGMGKSTFVQKLMNIAPCYLFPPDGWFTRYHNYTYQFIIWDEMCIKKMEPSFLNLFLEGSRCQLPVKGDLTHKWDNPLVIMLSNKPLREHLRYMKSKLDKELYSKTLSVRVKEIEITKPLFEFIAEIFHF